MKLHDIQVEHLDEAVKKNQYVIITDGPYKNKAGHIVFSKVQGDVRYYVIELDDESGFKGMPAVVTVGNGDYNAAEIESGDVVSFKNNPSRKYIVDHVYSKNNEVKLNDGTTYKLKDLILDKKAT